jgi:para-aminobenzoate synthetase component I
MNVASVSPEQIISFALAEGRGCASILDSCGTGQPGRNRLIAGIHPLSRTEIRGPLEQVLSAFDEGLSNPETAAIFTISYDFGRKLNKTGGEEPDPTEPDIYVATFDTLLIHDYDSGETSISGSALSQELLDRLQQSAAEPSAPPLEASVLTVSSNFTREAYISAVERIKERIRAGETYQTNLTQQLTVETDASAADVFLRLRQEHPAPFAAFLDRGLTRVVSASPEQFVVAECVNESGSITAAPIKGTRRRGLTLAEDARLRDELLNSEKDRAENIMIVDLLRNDLGRISKHGSVRVKELCRLDEHPTLFHLVSEVEGELHDDARFSDVISAVFPCGSITGAPKIRTMEIIEQIEPDPRGLSMGAIGCWLPAGFSPVPYFAMSVAIRTMVEKDGKFVFNVGGGVTIDSDPAAEYEESLLKAKALLRSLCAGESASIPTAVQHAGNSGPWTAQ